MFYKYTGFLWQIYHRHQILTIVDESDIWINIPVVKGYTKYRTCISYGLHTAFNFLPRLRHSKYNLLRNNTSTYDHWVRISFSCSDANICNSFKFLQSRKEHLINRDTYTCIRYQNLWAQIRMLCGRRKKQSIGPIKSWCRPYFPTWLASWRQVHIWQVACVTRSLSVPSCFYFWIKFCNFWFYAKFEIKSLFFFNAWNKNDNGGNYALQKIKI